MKNRSIISEILVPCVLGVAMLFGTVGCYTVASVEGIDEAKNSPKEFLLGPEDVLDILVWKNEELSQKAVVVRPDGKISMPLIGEVQANGLSANQLSAQIAAKLKDFKDNPVVTASVKEVNSYYVYVLGEVVKPGKYQLKSLTTVLQAVALAGGFNVYAAKNRLQVIRQVSGDDNREAGEIRIPVRYDDLVSGTGPVGNFILKTGDTVVVP